MFNTKIFSFKKNQAEKKSYRHISELLSLDCNYSFSSDPAKFIDYYVKACPVFTATKRIADAVAPIPIVIKDKRKNEFVYDHPALKLLKNPNPFKSGNLLMKEMVGFYILTGNSYLNVIGKFDPVELDTINPKLINIQANNNDGYPEYYGASNTSGEIVYRRDEKKKFKSRDGNQLIHLRDFNPQAESDNLVGASTFLGCQLEISQYILASIHNNALLENQARPSGLLTYKGKDALSDTQVDGVKSILKGELAGAANAGSTTFLNGEFDWVQLSQSVKDMDFPTLKKKTEESVYNAAKIPLPLVSADTMTLANMEAATYTFYDVAVLPVLDQILSFLTQNILSRFKGSENLEFAYDDSAIEALANRKVDEALKSAQTGVLTTDEIRSIMGKEALKTGGDTVYQPMNLIPIGTDAYTSDNRNAPAKEKAIFTKTMEESGTYTKEQIQQSVVDYYGNSKS